MYVEAKRVGTLGRQGTERKIDGKYYCYKLPDGFDFVVYKGQFLDQLVASRNGDLYGETKHSTKDKLVYKKIRTEIHHGIKYAVFRFSKEAVKRMFGEEEAEKDKRASIPVKDVIFETFRKEEITRKIECIDGDPNNTYWKNLRLEPEEWTKNIDWDVFMKVDEIISKNKKRMLYEHNLDQHEQSMETMMFSTALEIAADYKGDEGNLKEYTKTKLEWRINNWARDNEHPIIYTNGNWEDAERTINHMESGRRKPGSKSNKKENIEKKQARMSRDIEPGEYPLDEYPIKEEPRRVRGRTPLGDIYVD